MAKVTMKERKEKLAALLVALVASEAVTQDAADSINGLFGSQVVSTKINDKGEVFCTYFQTYLPADQFHTSGKGKIDSMSIEGKKLYRTQKSMVNKANSEVLKGFRSKDISAEEMEKLLADIEANAGHRYPQGTESINPDYPFTV